MSVCDPEDGQEQEEGEEEMDVGRLMRRPAICFINI